MKERHPAAVASAETVLAVAAPALDRSRRPALVVGVAAMAICVLGAFFDPQQFFRAYLAAHQFFLGLGLGCLVLLMIYYLTGGAWGFVVRSILECGVRTLPLLAIGFLPTALGLAYVYPWTNRDLLEHSAKLRLLHGYLNEPFFWARAAAYFLVWLLTAYLILRWSRALERTGQDRFWQRCINFSGPGLVLYGVTVHFASVDWLMSLQPDFHSTIFGPLTATGHIVSAFALALFVLPLVCRQSPLEAALSPRVLIDLGSLLLSFVVIWMYMEWFQFMLVWIANMQVDVVWYGPRLRGGWEWVALALALFHFGVPFCALLMRRVKQNPRALRQVAGLLLVMHLLFSYYQVVPAFAAEGLSRHWMDFLLPVGWGGIWWALFAWLLRGRALVPVHDPNAAEALRLRRVDEEEAHWDEVLKHA